MEREPGWTPALRESAWVLTAVGALLYLAGHLYLSAFYGYLGIMDTRIPANVPYVMVASFQPLFFPVGILALVAAQSFHFHPRKKGRASWFFPLPAAEALAIVFTVWLLKILADSLHPANTQWGVYARRDVLFFLLGLVAIAVRWSILWWTMKGKGTGRLSTGTWTFTMWIAMWTLIALGISLMQGQWNFSLWETLALALGPAYVVYLIVRDLRAPRAKMPQPRPDAPLTRDPNVLLWLWVVITLLLSVTLMGSVHAKEAAAGCSDIKTVAFDPPLNGAAENTTYWLILHEDGRFFVRPFPPSDGPTRMVLEEPGHRTEFANRGAPVAC